VNVESADASGVACLILTLDVSVVELMALAVSEHACGAVEVREVGALE
jgi:hypothetical protein